MPTIIAIFFAFVIGFAAYRKGIQVGQLRLEGVEPEAAPAIPEGYEPIASSELIEWERKLRLEAFKYGYEAAKRGRVYEVTRSGSIQIGAMSADGYFDLRAVYSCKGLRAQKKRKTQEQRVVVAQQYTEEAPLPEYENHQ